MRPLHRCCICFGAKEHILHAQVALILAKIRTIKIEAVNDLQKSAKAENYDQALGYD
jgi:hypothetical protein